MTGFILAQSAASVNWIEVLGPTAAAVAIAWMFLQFFTNYLKEESKRRDELFTKLYGEMESVVKGNTQALKELYNLVVENRVIAHDIANAMNLKIPADPPRNPTT